ncbi:MAG TPA: MBL fold metallo-hydrolase [Candidatus Methylomirabilis sp.]|nr:MBL fold metallo-hydrolase [Candidatus Methylomirabilis sp.]
MFRSSPASQVRVVLGQNPGLETGPGTNTYLFGGEQLILIDTGAGVPAYDPLLQEAVSALEGRLSLILLSHGHADHIGGLPVVRRLFPDAVARKYPGEAPVSVVEPIAAGELIRQDGITLQAIHTPGHATDHLCFYWLEERALFSGDLILGEGTAVIPRVGGCLMDYLASLKHLRSLEIRRIYPGHGPVIEDAPAKITEYLEHRHMRERQVLDTLGAGARTIREMVARIYADVPRELHSLAEESVWNHLVKLEGERRVRRIQEAGRETYELLT